MIKKLSFVASFYLLLGTQFVIGQDAMQVIIKEQALVVSNSMFTGDYQTLLNHTHPNVIEFMGGKETALKILSKDLESLKDEIDLDKIEYEVSDEIQIAEHADGYHCLVPTTMIMEMDGMRMKTSSYLFGFSDKEGKHWNFIEADRLNHSSGKKIFPDFKTTLIVPNDQPMEIVGTLDEDIPVMSDNPVEIGNPDEMGALDKIDIQIDSKLPDTEAGEMDPPDNVEDEIVGLSIQDEPTPDDIELDPLADDPALDEMPVTDVIDNHNPDLGMPDESNGKRKMRNKITTFLMFEGNAKPAMDFYASIFQDFQISSVSYYDKEGPGKAGTVKEAIFIMNDQEFMCIDSPVNYDFTFTPAVSLYVECSSLEEIRIISKALTVEGKVMMPLAGYGFSEKFAWINDKYGVSWQLIYNKH